MLDNITDAVVRIQLLLLPAHSQHTLTYDTDDGHSASLALALSSMTTNIPEDVTVYGLFQAAEETGEGAKQALLDERLSTLEIDGVFGSHNIPGKPLGEVLVIEGLTATASSGLCLSVKGIRGHSSSNTRDTPVPVVCDVALEALKRSNEQTRCAIVGLDSGNPANYGVSPEMASLHLTFRSSSMSLVQEAIEHVENHARAVAKVQSPNLEVRIQLVEPFSETVSRPPIMCEHVRVAAQVAGLNMRNLDTNFLFSEDCGLLLDHWSCGGCFFGIGAGENTPNLHEETYDWPDELTEKLASLWISIPHAMCMSSSSSSGGSSSSEYS